MELWAQREPMPEYVVEITRTAVAVAPGKQRRRAPIREIIHGHQGIRTPPRQRVTDQAREQARDSQTGALRRSRNRIHLHRRAAADAESRRRNNISNNI